MPFDPDAYLAQKNAPAPAAAGGFDPDAYLAQKQPVAAPGASVSDGFSKGGLSGAWDAMKQNNAGYDQRQAAQGIDTKNMDPGGMGAGYAIPAGALGAAGTGLAKLMEGSRVARMGANTAIGAANGAIDAQPGDTTSGALRGAAVGGGLGALGEAAGLVPAAIKGVGRVAAKMSHTGVEGYTANPEMGEAAYNQFKTDPNGFQQNMADKVKQGSEALYNNVVQPAKNAIRIGIHDGVPVEVNPNQFRGSTKADLMERLRDQAVRDAATAKNEFPDMASRSLSPEESTRPIGNLPEGESATAAAPQEATPQLVGNDGMPLKQTPPPMELPSTVRVSKPTLMDMEEASGKAARFKASPYGLDNGPAAANEANDNSILNGLLGDKYQADTKALAPAARTGSMLNKMLSKNPSRILNTSNAIGATPIRAARQAIADAGGPDLESLATSMQGAKELNDPNRIHGLLDQLLTQPAGKFAIKTAYPAAKAAAAGAPAASGAANTSLFLNKLINSSEQ